MSDQTASQPTIAERMRDAAVRRDAARGRTLSALRDMLIGDRPPGRRLGEIVTVAPGPEDAVAAGDYVATVIEGHGDGEIWTWTTVHNGVSDHVLFASMDRALLHLIGRRYGSSDPLAASYYAARVLDLPPES